MDIKGLEAESIVLAGFEMALARVCFGATWMSTTAWVGLLREQHGLEVFTSVKG